MKARCSRCHTSSCLGFFHTVTITINHIIQFIMLYLRELFVPGCTFPSAHVIPSFFWDVECWNIPSKISQLEEGWTDLGLNICDGLSCMWFYLPLRSTSRGIMMICHILRGKGSFSTWRLNIRWMRSWIMMILNGNCGGSNVHFLSSKCYRLLIKVLTRSSNQQIISHF